MVDVRDTPRAGYKEILTGYRVLATKGGNALLEVELITGRTHQIRAHMAHIGHPLLGDGKYGINRTERERGYKFQALYAFRLAFKKTDAPSALSYLEGKQFEIDRAGIWFLRDFPMGDV